MNKLKLIFLLIIILFFPSNIHADSVTDNALNFLKLKQDSVGKITTGFSAPSQWAAIAFAINGIDISTVKNSDKSLKDFLLTDIPSESSSVTDWENRIIAIVAIGEDPTNFGAVNYVQKLEGFYSDGHIGDICSLNSDIFGLLALIASGNSSTAQIKQDTLNFITQKQDPQDGGFGFSAPGCSYYLTSADMTGAAVQALQAAKDNGLTNLGLDDAIAKAKNYLVANQDSDGGFGYSNSSDSDTTGWALMGFNSLGLQESTPSARAKSWLLTQQSSQDKGFQAFDYGSNTFVSNATTTAQSIIALSGKGWITKIFTPSATSSATPSLSPVPTATPTSMPTPTPAPSPILSTPNPTPMPTPTTTLSPSSAPIITASPTTLPAVKEQIASTPKPEVLGEETVNIRQPEGNQQELLVKGFKDTALPVVGVISLFSTFKFLEGRRWKR